MRSLTPEDIKRENAYRTAQRKAGKSRKGNIKDPNAPKKPLSAYFMFLQRIRADPDLVREVFGDETETTKQSVLAAAKWRSMTDDERKVRTFVGRYDISPNAPVYLALLGAGGARETRVRSRAQDVRGRHDRIQLQYQFQHPAGHDQLYRVPIDHIPATVKAGAGEFGKRW